MGLKAYLNDIVGGRGHHGEGDADHRAVRRGPEGRGHAAVPRGAVGNPRGVPRLPPQRHQEVHRLHHVREDVPRRLHLPRIGAGGGQEDGPRLLRHQHRAVHVLRAVRRGVPPEVAEAHGRLRDGVGRPRRADPPLHRGGRGGDQGPRGAPGGRGRRQGRRPRSGESRRRARFGDAKPASPAAAETPAPGPACGSRSAKENRRRRNERTRRHHLLRRRGDDRGGGHPRGHPPEHPLLGRGAPVLLRRRGGAVRPPFRGLPRRHPDPGLRGRHHRPAPVRRLPVEPDLRREDHQPDPLPPSRRGDLPGPVRRALVRRRVDALTP